MQYNCSRKWEAHALTRLTYIDEDIGLSTNYNVKLAGDGLPGQAEKQALILESARAAGLWLSTYVSGTGTIDVELRFDADTATMSAHSVDTQFVGTGKAQDGKTYRLYEDGVAAEIRSGVDVNGAKPDAIINVGTTNLDRYYWFDESLGSADDIPRDKTDGFRIMLHELLHTMGFNGWLANGGHTDPTASAASLFDRLVRFDGERSYFVGEHASKAYGAEVPLTNVHLGDAITFAEDRLTGGQTLMSYDGPYNGQRISLDPVVIGVLRDLGLTVRDEQAVMRGDGQPVSTLSIDTRSGDYEIDRALELTFFSAGDVGYAFLLEDVDRIQFKDITVALDTGRDMVAGQAYRLYQAAFDREPDVSGLGYWIKNMDQGLSLNNAAEFFVGSPEFLKVYGSTPSNAVIVDKFYEHVLGRKGDAGGIAHWNALLDAKTLSVAQVLASFSESAENFTALAEVIGNGFEYMPYG